MATTYDMPAQPERKRRRRTRWEQVDLKEHETKNLVSRLDRITQTINTNAIPVEDLCRSPSPEPRYDNCGKRVNTRYDRAIDKLETERFKLCSRLKVLDPDFRPPRGMRPPRVADKLYLPKEKEGTLNFIGLILGPRGNTQKRLERDYDCKVAIRGKGSVKDGRARGPAQPEDNEQLHVIITAEGLDAKVRIDKCKKKILDIITPRQDDDNDHKQAQLRELAQLNGTLREQDRDFRQARGLDSAVKCSICSDSSHPTSDCPKKDEADADYASFMAQLHGESEAEVKKAPAPQGQDQSAPPWLAPGAFATRTPSPPPDTGSTQIGQWYRPFAGDQRQNFRHPPAGRPYPYQPGPPGPPGAPLGVPPGAPLVVPPGAPPGAPPGVPPGPPPFGHAPPAPMQPYGQGMFPVPSPPPDGLGAPPPPPPPPPPMEDGMPPPPPPPPPLAQDDLPPPPPPPPPG